MRFDRESWRKLYVRESVAHRLLPLLCRGLRDHLIKHARVEDGILLEKTEAPGRDLAVALGAHADEIETVAAFVEALIRDGYLSHKRNRLWITKFVEGQEARSSGAKRQKKYRDTKKRRKRNVTGDATGNVTKAQHVTSQIDETRREETTLPQTPAAAAEPALADRARKVLENPHDGQYAQPSKWPEVQRNARSLSEPFGIRDLKLTDFPPRDADLRALLEAYVAGYTPEQLDEAGRRAESDPYFRDPKRRGPAAFTPAVLRRLLADQKSETIEWRD